MNRNLALWLSTTMAMGTQQHEAVDGYCEKNGRHCTVLQGDHCGRFNVPLETTASLDHKRCDECKRTNCMIGRTT